MNTEVPGPSQVISLDTTTWEERLLTNGLPFKSSMWTYEMAIVDPNFLGDKLIFTLFRVAGSYEDF